MLTFRASIRMALRGVSDAVGGAVLPLPFGRRASAASALKARSWAKFKGGLPRGTVLSLPEGFLVDAFLPWSPPSPPSRLPMSQGNDVSQLLAVPNCRCNKECYAHKSWKS
jgi:hypothetical protein